MSTTSLQTLLSQRQGFIDAYNSGKITKDQFDTAMQFNSNQIASATPVQTTSFTPPTTQSTPVYEQIQYTKEPEPKTSTPLPGFIPEPGTPEYYTQGDYVASHSGAPIAPRLTPETLQTLPKEEQIAYKESVNFYTKAGYPEFAGQYAAPNVAPIQVTEIKQVPVEFVGPLQPGVPRPSPTSTLEFTVKPSTTLTPVEQAVKASDVQAAFSAKPQQGTAAPGLSMATITQNLSPDQKAEFRDIQEGKVRASMLNLGLTLGAGALAPVLGPAAALKGAAIGLGLGQAFKTGETALRGGDVTQSLLTPSEAYQAATSGVIFAGVGKGTIELLARAGPTGAKIAGYSIAKGGEPIGIRAAQPGEHLAITSVSTRQAVGASLGRVGAQTATMLPVGAGLELGTTGEITPGGLGQTALFGAAFAGIGEVGGKIRPRLPTILGGGVKTQQITAREIQMKTPIAQGQAESMRVTEVGVKETRVPLSTAKTGASILEKSKGLSLEFTGTEKTTKFVEPSQSTKTLISQTNKQGIPITEIAHPLAGEITTFGKVSTGNLRQGVFTNDIKALQKQVTTNKGNMFTETRRADPFLASLKGESFATKTGGTITSRKMIQVGGANVDTAQDIFRNRYGVYEKETPINIPDRPFRDSVVLTKTRIATSKETNRVPTITERSFADVKLKAKIPLEDMTTLLSQTKGGPVKAGEMTATGKAPNPLEEGFRVKVGQKPKLMEPTFDLRPFSEPSLGTAKPSSMKTPLEGIPRTDSTGKTTYEGYSVGSKTSQILKTTQKTKPNFMEAETKNAYVDMVNGKVGAASKQPYSLLSAPVSSQQQSSPTTQQLVTNPFTQQKQKPYYYQPTQQTDEYEQIYGASYPKDSGIQQPQTIMGSVAANAPAITPSVASNYQQYQPTVFAPITSTPQKIQPVITFNQNYMPKNIEDQTPKPDTGIKSDFITGQTPSIPYPTERQDLIQRQQMPITPQTQTSTLFLDFGSKNRYPPYPPVGFSLPSGPTRTFGFGKKQRTKSHKRVYPILTGLELLGKETSDDNESFF